jgi:hypothetical protein
MDRSDDRPMPQPALVARLRAAVLDRGGAGGAARRLVAALAPERASDPDRFRAHVCEAAIAARLWRRGCELEFEVPGSTGRTVDVLVRRGDERFALHIKRWTPTRRGATAGAETTLRVPAAIRSLEQISRPYLVAIRWPRERTALESFVEDARAFLLRARVGDERTLRAEGGAVVGRLRVLAPWPGDRVVLAVGLASARDDALDEELPRLQRLLRKAYSQFMPRVENVILIVGGSAAAEDLVDVALAGSHVERWDLFPARGQRVAHGRGDDGFWTAGRYALSRHVAWCPWSDARGAGPTRLWSRFVEPSPLLRALFARRR